VDHTYQILLYSKKAIRQFFTKPVLVLKCLPWFYTINYVALPHYLFYRPIVLQKQLSNYNL